MSGVQRRIGPLTLDIPAAVIGVQILVKGMEKLESIGQHPFIVSAILALGAFILVASALPLWLERRIAHLHALFHVAEGVAMGLSALLLFEKGRLRIPIILVFVGLLYVVAGFLESRPEAERERLAAPLLKGIGWAIVAGGLVLAGFTMFGDRDAWALGAAGFFVLIGAACLLGAPWLLRPKATTGVLDRRR
jgi:uncharacterized membrane protein YhhN